MDGLPCPVAADRVWSALLARAHGDAPNADLHPVPSATPDADATGLVALYAPLCRPLSPGESYVIGHLGQSLDGCIATKDGASRGLNGAANICHLHRLRALCDAIVVGAGTVAADDPRLTTRAVPGPNPVRVILDPRRRLDAGHRVFQDGAAPTLVCCALDCERPPQPAPGQAALLALPRAPESESESESESADLDLAALLAALRARGLRRVFVEGGGVTVSRFLAAGLLDRLQLAVAPLLLGAGRPGLALPPGLGLGLDGASSSPVRLFRQGRDVLYDFDLRAPAGEPGPRGSEAGELDGLLPVWLV